MAQPVIQHSFATGEWAPNLNARTDLQKYHSAAALLRNFFVDYRGGASTRAGTKYVLQARTSGKPVRLIPFAASFTVNYLLEFGDFYIRFFVNGAPVLSAAGTNFTGVTNANPGTITDPGHGYSVGDWIFIQNVLGMTQLNGNYYIVSNVINVNQFQISDLFGNPVDTTAFGVYTGGGQARSVYTITSPYAAADLAQVKFAQNVNSLILCHPNYAPQVLTINSVASWSITAINFGPTLSAPTGVTGSPSSNLPGGGSWFYNYLVTAVDSNGLESPPSAPVTFPNKAYIGTTQGQNIVAWNSVPGAVSYNVYKALPTNGTPPASGAAYGFIGNVVALQFPDPFPGIAPDFSQTPPIVRNPFLGSSVLNLTLQANSNYTAVPSVTIAAPPNGLQATAYVTLTASNVTLNNGGASYAVNQQVPLGNGLVIVVNNTSGGGGGGAITAFGVASTGSITGAGNAVPANPITDPNPPVPGGGASFNVTWNIGSLILITGGSGYLTAPAVSFSSGTATAISTLSPASAGNPGVPGFFDQRLVLAAPPGAVQTFYMSQPGSYYSFNISDPVQADDAITGTIVSGKLNVIQSLLPMPSGLIALTSQQAFLINGGNAGTPITPSDATANAQSYNGASNIPPITINFDILYVQAKASIVRDLTFNFYTQIYTGTDISVLSSHLFFGFQLLEWAWAEEPFKIVWAVRNDGTLLSLTYVKEQEVVGWAHHDTNGLFKSVASITETVGANVVDAVYVVVQRVVNGHTVQYIERMADRFLSGGYTTAWCVDAGIQYSGAPATNFSGAQHLAGMTVTGLADGAVIAPFVMPVNGSFVLPAASLVTVGLAFTPDLQTLALDVGEPTAQGKVKQINAVDIRCMDTLGLSIGSSFNSLIAMKDLVVGNVSSMLVGQDSQIVAGLVTGDARTYIDSRYTVPGQYCIRQTNPYPATILGVIPQITIGDTPK